MDNIILASRDVCTGCGACCHACPNHAVSMEKDAAGFLYPVIHREKCVKCNQCVLACPVTGNREVLYKKPVKCFYAQSRNSELLNNCASGGIISELAVRFIEDGGIVAGSVYQQDFSVKQVLCRSLKDIEKIRGSKYVQSSTGEVYKEIKDALESGARVLYTGTPCQAAGLKCYLEKEYKNLVTADFYCHSAASPRAFQIYIRQQSKRFGKVNAVEFKCKDYGYSFPTLRLETEKGSRYFTSQNDPYMRAFLERKSTRPCCDSCRYRGGHMSDLTVGDEYSVKAARGFSKNGLSKVTIWNEKGKSCIRGIKNRLKIRESRLCDSTPANGNTSEDKIDFSLAERMGEDKFFHVFFRVGYKDRIAACLRFLLFKTGLHDAVKKIYQR